jgi:hypothetical protein
VAGKLHSHGWFGSRTELGEFLDTRKGTANALYGEEIVLLEFVVARMAAKIVVLGLWGDAWEFGNDG